SRRATIGPAYADETFFGKLPLKFSSGPSGKRPCSAKYPTNLWLFSMASDSLVNLENQMAPSCGPQCAVAVQIQNSVGRSGCSETPSKETKAPHLLPHKMAFNNTFMLWFASRHIRHPIASHLRPFPPRSLLANLYCFVSVSLMSRPSPSFIS